MKSLALLLFLVAAARAELVSGDSVLTPGDSAYEDDDGLYRHIVIHQREEVPVAPAQEIAVVQPENAVLVVQSEEVSEPTHRFDWIRFYPTHFDGPPEHEPPHENHVAQESRHDPEIAAAQPQESPPQNLFNAPSERPARNRGEQH